MGPLLLQLIAISIAAVCYGKSGSEIDSNLLNVDVKRTIDITSHLPKISFVAKIENAGSSAISSYLLAIEADLASHLSYVGALVSFI